MSKNIWLALGALVAFGTALSVYVGIYGLSIVQSLFYAISIFALDVKTPEEFTIRPAPEYWQLIYVAGILAAVVVSFAVVSLYFKIFKKENKQAKILKKGDFLLVIGLGESNRVYIDSVLEKNTKTESKDIVVIEKNKDNPYIVQYEDDIVIVIGDASKPHILENLILKQENPVVISTDNDITNLEITTQLLAINNEIKLFIHLEDRNLRHFHKENGILSGKNIKVYSYQEEAARELFEKYDIDGESNDIIKSSYPYAITVVGDTSLSYEVIAQACIMGQLPNANQLTIYCVDKKGSSFKEHVELHFPEIEQVPNVTLTYIELDVNTKSFYTDSLWQTKMTNIILCFEDDQKNLDVASNLTNLTFLDKVVDERMKTNIHIAMFNGYSLSDMIKKNNNMFKHLHVFGGINEINDEKYIIADERDKQAIVTNFIYENVEPKLKIFETYTYEYNTYDELGYGGRGYLKSTDEGWSVLSYFEKESNRAVADQMKMKLKYLGLKIVPSSMENVEKLYDINKELFYEKMKDRLLLAKMEHNRWNAFHYLNGFRAMNFISKTEKDSMKKYHQAKKVHMCLIEFDEFKKRSDELIELGFDEGQFEGYDFMINEHIPLILANAGYGIRIPVKIGVTGHRNVNKQKSIIDLLYREIFELSEIYAFESIISPLADGTDRIVAKIFLDRYDSRLITPLPFEKEEYKKDFSDESIKEFNEMLETSYSNYRVGSLEDDSRNECYLNVGKEVVDTCDILIALWDGKEANGLGGTGDIVSYALEKKKPILHINITTLSVIKINFKGEY